MNANENIHTGNPEEVIVLGVASIETKGVSLTGEEIGGNNIPGISEE